jgi:hypothetical protein
MTPGSCEVVLPDRRITSFGDWLDTDGAKGLARAKALGAEEMSQRVLAYAPCPALIVPPHHA